MMTFRILQARTLLALLIALPLPPAVAATATCPAEDFDRFLHHFANEVAVQQAFVSTPLQSDSIDPDAEPEPAPISRMLDKSDLQFPLMPSEQQQLNQGLSLTKTVIDPQQVQVKLTKADTDYQVSFFFRRQGCWTLYRMQDDSL